MQNPEISAWSVLIGIVVGGVIFAAIPDKNVSAVIAVFAGWLTIAHLHLGQQFQALVKRVKDLEWEVGTHLQKKS